MHLPFLAKKYKVYKLHASLKKHRAADVLNYALIIQIVEYQRLIRYRVFFLQIEPIVT